MGLKSILALIFITGFGAGSFADCPRGEGESTLTVQRVMRNFMVGLRASDQIVIMSKDRPQEVRDDEFKKAIEGIDIAIACAEESLTSCENLMSVPLAVEYMQQFSQVLTEYKAMFSDVLAQPITERSLIDIASKRESVRALASESHEKIGPLPHKR